MAISFPDFKRISFDEANPHLVGMRKAQELQAKILANQIASVNAKYADPKAYQALQKSILENKWYSPKMQSDIGLQGAQANLAGAHAGKERFLTNNPEYINPAGMYIQQAMEHQGRQGGQGGGAQGGGYAPQSGGQAGGQPGAGQAGGYPQDAGSNPEQNGIAEYSSPAVREGQSAPVGAPNEAQQSGYSPTQYDPNAMAYNPPNLQSPTGNPNLDTGYYKTIGMNPIEQAKMELAKSQAEKYQTDLMDRNKVLGSQAVFANDSTLNAHKFLDAIDRTSAMERGPLGSKTPGLSDAAQEADANSAGMVSAAAKLFQGDNAVHKSDIELQKIAKTGRHLNKEVAFDLAQGVIAKNDRLKEQQMFYAKGASMKLKPEILDAMWNKFETDRPYINTDTYLPNDAYKGTSSDYLKPEVVNAYLAGREYFIPDQKQLEMSNWNKDDIKQINKWAQKKGIHKDEVDKFNLYKMARAEGKSFSEFKSELIKKGVLK